MGGLTKALRSPLPCPAPGWQWRCQRSRALGWGCEAMLQWPEWLCFQKPCMPTAPGSNCVSGTRTCTWELNVEALAFVGCSSWRMMLFIVTYCTRLLWELCVKCAGCSTAPAEPASAHSISSCASSQNWGHRCLRIDKPSCTCPFLLLLSFVSSPSWLFWVSKELLRTSLVFVRS